MPSELDLQAFLREQRERVESALDALLPSESSAPCAVHAAMRYSVFAGGKRLRPILALSAARAGAPPQGLSQAAAALELIHTYSLIHDDLPAMDDDSLRRGKPTCHVAFGEATALLAGDALLTLAFETLARQPAGDPLAVRRLEALALVARAAGTLGMIGGQAADLDGEGVDGDEAMLESIHARKTGALISASLEMGGILAGLDAAGLELLRKYGRAAGLAFQIVDDILDVEGDAEALGKTAGKDARAGKLTYPALLGLDGSRRRAEALIAQASAAADGLGQAAAPLSGIAELILHRRS